MFPRSGPNCAFPKWPIGDGEKRKIAFNEWPLLSAQIASPNVRLWAFSADPAFAGGTAGQKASTFSESIVCEIGSDAGTLVYSAAL